MLHSPAGLLPRDVARVELPTPWPVGTVNAYLLLGEPLTLVDCGPRTEAALGALERGLGARGVVVEDIELLLLTHQHPDHVGLAATVARRSGAAVGVCGELAQILCRVSDQLERDLAYLSALSLRHGMSRAEVAELTRHQQSLRAYFEDVEATVALRPGESVDAGGRRLRVELRPGHSPTDTVLIDDADGTMLAGDHLLWGISSNPVAHAPPPPGDPAAAAAGPGRPRPLVRYVESLALTRAERLVRVLPGHGEPFSGHADLINTRLRFHRRRAQSLLALIRQGPTSSAELVTRLWPELPERARFLGLSEVVGHVDLLALHGQIVETIDDDGCAVLEAAPSRAARTA